MVVVGDPLMGSFSGLLKAALYNAHTRMLKVFRELGKKLHFRD